MKWKNRFGIFDAVRCPDEVNAAQKSDDLPRSYPLGLILLLCLSLWPETVNANPKATQIITHQLVTQTDLKSQAQQLLDEGRKLYNQGKGTAESLQQAIKKLETALPLWRKLGDKNSEALTLNFMGNAYSGLGEKQKALDYYQQALILVKTVGVSAGEATTLDNIGKVYADLGEKQKTLDHYQQALSLWRAVGDRSKEATTLTNIGRIYSDLGEKQKALDYYSQALPLYKEVGDHGEEAKTLNIIGRIYSDLGEKQKALDYYSQALPLYKEVGDRGEEAFTLYSIGRIYNDLGKQQKALEYYQQALPLFKEVGDQAAESITLSRIGIVYGDLGEKQKALDYFQQSLPLWRAVGFHSEEAITLSNIGGVYSDLGEKQKALDYYQQALPLMRAVGDQKLIAKTLNDIGLVYSDLGEKQKALDYYSQALPLRKAVGNRGGEATTLNNIGRIYDDLGEKQKAFDYYSQALPLFKAVGDRGREAGTLNNIGAVYSALGEKQKALDYFNQSLVLYKSVGDLSGEAVTLNNIGHVYSALGEKQKALEYYSQSLVLYKSVGDRSGEAVTLNNIGHVYSALGEQQKALEYYSQSLVLYKSVGDRGGEAVTLNNIGTVYAELGEKQKALEYYSQALPLLKVVGDRSGEAATLHNIAAVYDALGEKQQALDYLKQALPLRKAVGDRGGEAATLNGIGTVYAELGEKQKALDYYSQALPLRKAVGDRSGEATTLNNIGGVYADLGEKQKALDYSSQALPLRKAVGDRSGEALTLYNIASSEANRGNWQAALVPIQASIEIIEELRTKIISPELRQSYFATVQDYYKFYIQLLMDLHQQNPSQGYDKQAFNISERSRARTLLELLTEANANIKEGIDPQLLAKEKTLQSQLDATEKQRLEINNNPKSSADQKAAIEKQQKDLLAQYQTLQNEIRAKSPKYAALKYPQPLTLAQVQQQILDPDTALLQYSLGKEKSYLWVITKDGFTSHSLPVQKEIETAARELLNAIQYGKDDTANISQAANQLSQLVLTPAAKLKQKRLVIVPDGVLSYVPFATLTLNDNPLINQHELVNLPSSSSIVLIRKETQNRKPAPKALTILADPIFSADDSRLKTPQKQPITNPDLALNRVTKTLKKSRAVGDNNQFMRLPGTRQEAQAILALLPKTETIVAFDDQANLNLAINPQLSQYRMLHLATHGVFNGEDPAYSGIILSLVDAKGTSINGFLRLNEIFNLNLPAELVVLSACETGLGKEIKGEGLVGLTRGFMYAGTPRVLVSLWKVDDQATAEMMTRFYKLILEKKLPPAQALREAQLQMQNETEWKSPYYWSAFILQGEWR